MQRGVLGLCAIVLFSSFASSARAADKWTTPHPGVRHLYRTSSTPWRIFALEIDLCAQGVSLRATQSSERKRTVSSFAKLVGAEAAVNGDFFSFSTYGTSGLAMGKGVKWSDTADGTSEGFVAFGPDRHLLSPLKSVVNPPASWMREVVSGKPQVVTDGVAQATNPTEFCSTRHPRTAAGISKDGRKLILAVVDGRTSISVGMRCTELGSLMKGLGAWNALNLDGGGSSAMYVSGAGTVNDPSDGVERVVANHLGVFATGSGEPGSCDRTWEESALDALDSSTTTDVNGDGRADLCARGGAGVTCSLSTGSAFAAPISGPALSDASGWNDESNWSTLRMGDIDGVGRADLCARANDGVHCWLSDGKGFPTKVSGPALADAQGWNGAQYYGTLRLADVTGDGKDDLCARSSADFRCYPSTGTGFGAPIVTTALSDANGFDEPSQYGTLRMGDIDGDGRVDVCARAAAGMRCYRSQASGFAAAIDGPAWSDASGWGFVGYWSTIRLVDVDADGKADLCARGAKGLVCHLSNGNGFGAAVTGPAWSDDSGWSRHKHYSTLRFADLDGDGDLDVCARAAKGIVCAPWEGSGFGAAIDGPALSDAAGFGALRFYQTIRMLDLNSDGKADLCARASAGMRCYLSSGNAFGAEIVGPAWADATNWDEPRYFSTIRGAGPLGGPGGSGGTGGTGGASGNGGVSSGGVAGLAGGGGSSGAPGAAGTTASGGASSSGGGASSSGGGAGESGSGGAEPQAGSDEGGGCGCRTGTGSSPLAAFGALGLLALALRRRSSALRPGQSARSTKCSSSRS